MQGILAQGLGIMTSPESEATKSALLFDRAGSDR
jgi:hypothetical protein